MYSHAVCLVFVFFLGRLAVPRVGHGMRHAAFSFVRLALGCLEKKAGKRMMVYGEEGNWARSSRGIAL